MPSDKLAFVFPGQGAHCNGMLDAHSRSRDFNELYAIVCDVLGYSLLERTEADPELINSNLASSTLTVLASAIAKKCLREQAPDFVAGYSVGQLTALHTAGCFDFAELVQLVTVRAQMMDRCFASAPGAMLAVIGLPQKAVEDICQRLQAEGQSVWVSNINCLGQYSLSGTPEAIAAAKALCAEEKPKKLLDLPVAGAWHSPMLSNCQAPFAAYLRERNWCVPHLPVINNVTGDFFPYDVTQIKEELVKHLTHPVRWEAGLKRLVKEGCSRFVEVGYGNTLTKFGFFIDRSARYESFYGDANAICVE